MLSSENETIRIPIFAILLFEAFALSVRSYLQLELIDNGQPVALARNYSYLVVPPMLLVLTLPILKKQWGFFRTRFSTKNLTLRLE